MHIRISSVARNGKTYRYAQLVETFRRPADNLPAHRVIATLGDPDALDVENLRAALAAARAGKRVAVVRQARSAISRPVKPTACLRYLDLAVLLELWREVGLQDLLTDLLPQGEGQVSPASVVAALVLQRCVDPGSKLYASRWLPRTALPELLGIAPEQFNNTRLHRVLEDLDAATTSLMAKLPHQYLARDVAFASLFLDVSDTWFVGDGPALAASGKTKEGRIERKIGIVLLCNQDGMPLRWDVIPGSQADPTAMTRMLRAVSGLSWAAEAPIVVDRAMGSTAVIREMLQTNLRFVTALRKTEFDSYAPTLPHAPFASLVVDEKGATETHVEQATRCAMAAGLKQHGDDLFVLDLGIVDRTDVAEIEPAERRQPSSQPTVDAMRFARDIDEAVAQGRFASYAAAGRSHGLGKGVVSKYRILRGLSEQQQRDVLDGKLADCPLAALIDVAQSPDVEKRAKAFDALQKRPRSRRPRTRRSARAAAKPSLDQQPPPRPIRVRAVAYFNPHRFVEKRLAALRQVDSCHAFVVELRAKIAAAPRRYLAQQIHGLIDRELRAKSLLDVFTVTLTPASTGVGFDLEVTLDQEAWARRRRYDGFSVLITHPDVSIEPVEICRLYRAKDAVEKNFQIIKSVVQLRPVWHHTDAKVRAHVALCMLALLLERLLRQRLQTLNTTQNEALELLEPCRVSHYAASAGDGLYSITMLDDEQRGILKALRMLHLADDEVFAAKIRPR